MQSLAPICIYRLKIDLEKTIVDNIFIVLFALFLFVEEERTTVKYRRNNKTLWSITTQFFCFCN